MDALPQLWNLFRRDMSFVVPRALMPEEIEVNSLGQVVPLEKEQSFGLDVRLILLSFRITLRGKWEHRGSKF